MGIFDAHTKLVLTSVASLRQTMDLECPEADFPLWHALAIAQTALEARGEYDDKIAFALVTDIVGLAFMLLHDDSAALGPESRAHLQKILDALRGFLMTDESLHERFRTLLRHMREHFKKQIEDDLAQDALGLAHCALGNYEPQDVLRHLNDVTFDLAELTRDFPGREKLL